MDVTTAYFSRMFAEIMSTYAKFALGNHECLIKAMKSNCLVKSDCHLEQAPEPSCKMCRIACFGAVTVIDDVLENTENV